MVPLRNAKHEKYAAAIASGKSATEAMEAAGYSDPRNSTRLTKNDEIQRRIAELQNKAAERTVVTIEDIARQLDEDREFARKVGSASASVAATMGKAKVLGLIVEKQDHTSSDGSMTPVRVELVALTEDGGN